MGCFLKGGHWWKPDHEYTVPICVGRDEEEVWTFLRRDCRRCRKVDTIKIKGIFEE
jgi:hypothetical protein